jgi:hypothetical protein
MLVKRIKPRIMVWTAAGIFALFLCDQLSKLPAGLGRTEFLVYGQTTSDGVITTFAGSGVTLAGSDVGDGGMAINAPVGLPQSVAVDDLGNVYIADSNLMRIRKVLPSGIITTVAGGGTSTNIVTGSPATSVQLRFPSDVKVDRFL